MEFIKLVEIMEKLRSENGCPWDKVQTRHTLIPFIIEEAYEVIESLHNQDPEGIKEELGDLLFQIIFHAQIAKELGEFDMFDVIKTIGEKMIYRHPHVFAELKCDTPEQVLAQWNDRKMEEGKFTDSILNGIPVTLPALLKALKVQKRVSRVGFDWESSIDVLTKLQEEIGELKEAMISGNIHEIEGEIGDIMFTVVNISRHLKVNPEEALSQTTNRFSERFRYIEQKAKENGRDLKDMSLIEMDNLWEEAKISLKG
ncbi:MAG: nucleoside triphosphate pyrophosphohydrolase [Nitrospirae bacterium]|nr:nucleoside triphosphate pyrophosphohydrolase [Nitrospirota bacterium]